MSGVESGTAIMAAGLPASENQDILLLEQETEGGALIRFHLLRDGALALELSDSCGASLGFIDRAVTSPVRLIDFNRVTIAVRWSDSRIQDVFVDSACVYSLKDDGKAVSYYEVSRASSPFFSNHPPTDFSEYNLKAYRLRRHKLQNWVRRPERVQAGPEYAFASLAGELEQLGDLVALVKAGKMSHVAGIMARCRLMIIGKPMGLLQLCAAYRSAPLIMFTFSNPDHPLPKIATEPESTFFMTGSPVATETRHNPIDLDVWLDLKVLTLAKKYPNRELIREIGNTVGSHLDLDMQQSVVHLMKGRIRNDALISSLASYALNVAEIIMKLGRSLS